MAELKRIFSDAKMNKDMDERVVPNGQYRDAMNIEIATSEGSNVGTVQTLRANEVRSTIDQGSYNTALFSQGTTNILGPHNKATCVGVVAAADKDKIYYLMSAGDYSDTDTLHNLRKDYILEYDSITERSKYVFVDIYHVSTVTATAEASAQAWINVDAPSTVNQTGIRVGMTVAGTINSVQYDHTDGLKVSNIVYNASTTEWKIYLQQNGVDFSSTSASSLAVEFKAARVLKFSKHNIITGINILDDFIFWTDNVTEPKKINISRSLAGTGGSSTNVFGFEGANVTFDGATDNFHTRLVRDKSSYDLVTDRYEIVETVAGTDAVYVDESNVTVIRKAPTQPLELEMYRTSSKRVDSNGNENQTTAVKSASTEYVSGDSLVEVGDSVSISFNNDVDYRVGDILLVSSSTNTTSPNSFTNFAIRVKVTASNVDNPNVLSSTGFVVRILSIDSSLPTTALTWYYRLEDKRPLFENRFPRFSYRYKYQDGEYSTFAPFSEIAFLTDKYEYLPKQGYNLGMVNQLRGLKLKGYFNNKDIFPQDVVEIDMLYKEAGKPTVYTVKTIKPSDGGFEWPDLSSDSSLRGEFEIKSDMIHAVLPSNQMLRPWDNVPRKALAQEIGANRVVYGNYLQNYTILENPIIDLSLDQDSLSYLDNNYAMPSVKTMRKYQAGVVFSDKYGRETPVLTSKNAVLTVTKDASDTRNRLVLSLNESTPNIPSWAKYFSYYLKETSVEYYTMAMDRWYLAADGNVWISFPSSERNKLDNETFIVLKKGHGTNIAVKDKARYRILAIESEAPDFIKTEKKSLGRVQDGGGNVVGVGGQNGGFPLIDTDWITIEKEEFENAFGDQMHIMTPDSVYIRLYGQGQASNEYEVSRIALQHPTDGPYKLQIKEPFNDDISFTSTDDTLANAIDDLAVELIEHEVENRPEFDGRFFVKILRDSTLEQYVLSSQSEDFAVTSRWRLGYIHNNGYEKIEPFTGVPKFNTKYLTSDQMDPYDGINGYYGTVQYDYTTGTRNVTASGLHPTENLHFSADTANGGLGLNQYWWGDGNFSTQGSTSSDRTSLTALSQNEIDDHPLRALNDGTNENDQWAIGAPIWWENVRKKHLFFIDSATAYSFTGYQYDYPGLACNSDSDLWDNTANAEQGSDWGTTDGDFGNTKKGKGQPRRGIWKHDGGCYMDISWSGIGNHAGNTGFPDAGDNGGVFGNPSDGGFPQKLQDIYEDYPGEGTANVLFNATQFISELVSPGTRFRFSRDPDEHVYTVQGGDWPTINNSSGGTGSGYNDSSVFEDGTDIYKGIYGIRNFRTDATMAGSGANNYLSNDASTGDRNQYAPANVRQSWTISVKPEIGSMGPSYYSPTTGTNGYSFNNGTFTARDSAVPSSSTHENFRRALRHDFFGPYDAIEILQPKFNSSNKGGFVLNPAVWETEPKESVELDIYYQASGLIPLQLNDNTNEELIPIGSTFHTLQEDPWTATKHTVTAFNGESITFTPAVPTGTTLASGTEITFTKRTSYALTAVVNGNVSIGATALTLHGGLGTVSASNKLFSQKHYLDWNNCWCFGNGVESDRIRDDFNTAQVDNGVKASTVLAEQVREERRKHGLIWSGIYNSTSGVNDTNQFIAAEKITKDLNPIYGSIQSLLNRDTRLVMFCEDKVLRGVTNKDALYNADGNPQLISSNTVIGDVTPYQGDYGISKNPESMAVTPSTVYFTDAMRGKVLALSTEGVRPISDIGMKDYFSTLMSSYVWRSLGTYDERKKEYNVSLYKKYYNDDPNPFEQTTISYSEISKGWTSLKSFHPDNGISLNNNYITFSLGKPWKHHADGKVFNTFYGTHTASDITVLFNDIPESPKKFVTINYEGSAQNIPQFTTVSHANTYTGDSSTGSGLATTDFTDSEYFNLDATTAGWYMDNLTTNLQTCGNVYFKNKEDKYFGYPSGETTTLDNLDEREFSVQGIGLASISHDTPGQGNQITINVQNDINNTDWDTTGVQAVEASHWVCSSSNVLTVEGGSDIPDSTFVEMEISTNINGVVTGYPLSAANFEIPGAIATTSGSGNSTQYIYTVDGDTNVSDVADIDKITFSNNGTGLMANNTVKVRVDFDTSQTWPTSNHTYEIDIDEKASTPTTINKDFFFKTQYNFLGTGYQANPVVNNYSDFTETVVDAGSTSSPNSDFSDPTINSHAGSVEVGITTQVAKITFTAAANHYYMGGSTAPSIDFVVSEGYESAFDSVISDQVYSQPNHITSFVANIFYTPPSNSDLLQSESDQTLLGHKAIVNYVMKDISVAGDTDDITGITYPIGLDHGPNTATIKVFGKAEATYDIYVEKKTAIDSNFTSTSGGYYNFDTSLFQDAMINGEGTIGSDGLASHSISMPPATSDTRYDIRLVAREGATAGSLATMSSSVPTSTGDAKIIHYGLRTLTVTPVVGTSANFESPLPTVAISRPAIHAGSVVNATRPEKQFIKGGTGGVSSTTLTLTEGFKHVKTGMLLLNPFGGNGIPSDTKVTKVRRKIITLSQACTISNDTDLTIVDRSQGLVPFSVTIAPGSGKTFGLKSDVNFPASMSGTGSQVITKVDGTQNKSQIKVDSVRGIKSGMKATGTGITADPAYGYARVNTIDRTPYPVTNFTTTQDLADNTVLTYSWPQDDPTLDEYDASGGNNVFVRPHHVQASLVDGKLKVEGYLTADEITRDDTLDIHIEDYVNVT